MKIAVGSDHAGFDLKERLKKRLAALGHEAIDFGTNSAERVDYTDCAHKVGLAVVGGRADRGVLVCGTGIGVCIAANKVPGVRAALPYNEESAALARKHNDANVLCLGGRTMDPALAEKMMEIWLSTGFEGGRHAMRIAKLEKIEE